MLGQMRQKEGFMLVVAFLAGVQGLLSANAQQLAREGKIKPQDSVLYVRSAVGGTNTQNLLEGKTSQEIGITNFDGQILNSDRYFVIDSITVNYGVAATSTSPKAVDYTTALPAALKNANLLIRQDNEVIVKLPVADINAAKTSDDYYKVLGAFAFIRDQKTITLEIEFPAGGDLAPGAGNAGYAEVLLKGYETYIKR